MDESTRNYYAAGAVARAAWYETADVRSLHDILRPLAKRNLRVLEIGGGSGRDAAFLSRLGCSVVFTDGCPEMVGQAVRLHPELTEHARVATFPLTENDALLLERFDLILCVAVVMHLNHSCLDQLAAQLANMISGGGNVVVSHSFGGRDATAERFETDILFCERSAAEVGRTFAAAGFENAQQTQDTDGMGRRGICWMTHVFRKTV